MSQITKHRFDGLDKSELRVVDQICEKYEAASEPRLGLIERYVAVAPGKIQDVLFGELLAIELELTAVGELLPSQEPFHGRFPERRELIESIFRRLANERSETQIPPAEVESQSDIDDVPKSIGRFRIEKILGQGGFGIVYKAYDERLDRPVAIKVPRSRFVSGVARASNCLTEAKTVARLDHPNIVPVYELGHNEKFPFFLVTKFVDGNSLAARHNPKQIGDAPAVARLIATMAEALQHAHEQGLVHRDVKPGNILIDSQGQPHLADFGLVLREEDIGNDSGYAGTPAYMSPEQASGEGHHVDGRSDIFSLGIVFYELLVGRRPFGGSGKEKVMRNIVTSRPRPLRQFSGELPPELERICLKALSKRISRRYSTARDMASDLRDFLALSSSVRTAPISTTLLDSAASDSSVSQSSVSSSANDSAVAVIPRGLRSFDSRDKGFFLQLLPGPRNRDGLPESVWFWKTQIEETDREKTFSVGLIYGPSGCGKSSLVKAGLLPQLSDDVTTIFIEATGDDVENKLQQQLRMKFGELAENLNLGQSLAAIRRRPMVPGHKLLILIDQFEQWLHAQPDSENSGLLEALRQCDGQHVQCILMVRDDFWLSISRLMLELDVDLVPGHNIALVDLFDEDHARNVLMAFGQAFDKLPEPMQDLSKQQVKFLDRIIAGLSREGKVTCVRLALLAEMLKSKPWLPETLERVGGTEGVGVAFLNDTFVSPGSNPAYRVHREAAQQVLKALLPEVGSDIKGRMQSHDQLMEISGYQNQPEQFENLIRILDADLRLITPTETSTSECGDDNSMSTPSRWYLLTHDYLVHVVRQWITQSQRETLRGRAQLRLENRSREWQPSQARRYLPAWWEYANIRAFTRKKLWNPPQQQMMSNARNLHGIRWGCGLLAVFMVAFSVLYLLGSVRFQNQAEQAEIAVSVFCNSPGFMMPRAIEDLAQFPREMVIAKLRKRRESADPFERQMLSYALAAFGGLKGGSQELLDQLAVTANQDVPNLVEALKHSKPESLQLLGKQFDSHSQEDFQDKAKIAILALYVGDIAPAKLMCRRAADPFQRTWFIEQHASWHGRISELAEIAKGVDDPDLQSALCLAVGSTEPTPLQPRERKAWQPLANQWYQGSPDSGVHSAAGWMLRHWGMELPVIPATHEPTEGRNWHVAPSGMTMVKIPAGEFLNRMKGDWNLIPEDMPPQKITVSQDFLMSDREVSIEQFRRAMEDPDVGLRERPYLIYEADDDAQANIYLTKQEKVVERLYFENSLEQIKSRLEEEISVAHKQRKQRYLADEKKQPGGRTNGANDFELQRLRQQMKPSGPTGHANIANELNQIDQKANGSIGEDHPIHFVSWPQAVMYCNWLSRQEGLQPCYERTGQILRFPGELGYDYEEWQLIPGTSGYRLPTNAEWELACRAGTTTDYSFGNYAQFISRYAVLGQEWPEICGSKLPNGWGLFDMHGNLTEFCNDWVRGFRIDTQSKTDPMGPREPVYLQQSYRSRNIDSYKKTLRWRKIRIGGDFNDPATNMASYMHSEIGTSSELPDTGFRVVRSIR